MYTKEDVQRLLSDLGGLKSDKRDVSETGNQNRGLAADGRGGSQGQSGEWSRDTAARDDVRRQGGIPLDAQGREVRRSAGDPNMPERYIGNRDIDFGQPRPNLHNVDLHDIEIGEPYMFGLALDIFDPMSGEVFAVCRPHLRDFGHAEVFMTPNQIAGAIANARSFRLHNERAGLIPPRPLSDDQKADATKRQEAAKQQQTDAAKHDQDRVASENTAHEQEAQRIRTRETGEVAKGDQDKATAENASRDQEAQRTRQRDEIGQDRPI